MNKGGAMDTFAERLSHAMKLKEVRQLELAKATGVSTTAVNKWLKGNTKNLKSNHLFTIADFLDVSASWLVNGNDQTDLPFRTITLGDLRDFPAEYLEDIEDYILMKKHKLDEKLAAEQKKIA